MESSQSPNHPTPQSPNHLFVAGIWMLVLAGLGLVNGLCAGMFYLIAPFLVKTRDSAIQANIVLGVSAAIGIVFGALLMWQGILTLRGRAPGSVTRAFPPAIILIILFLLSILFGIGALAIQPIAAFAFPPFHILASALPPLVFLAYAARQLKVTSGMRALVVSLSWGALGGTFFALSLEVIIGVIMLGIAVGALALMPGGAALIERLGVELQALQTLDDQAILRKLIAYPGVIALAMVYFAGIVPLVEEAVKTLVVAFADPRRTQARDAILWGIAAGAGFAIVENALNTSTAIAMWAPAMFIRIGATIMHVTNGVTMARGWYAARVERRWSKLFIAYGVSVFLHAVWNALAIGLSAGAVVWLSEPRALRIESPWMWLNLALSLGLIALTFGGVGWIVFAVRTAREPSAQKIEEGDAKT